MSEPYVGRLPSDTVERAMRLSYVQAMLGAIYFASTGGMFLIGYALKLGADDILIGLMSTIPMLCVFVQLFSSAILERGGSPRRLTILSALGNVCGWGLVILIPYVAVGASPSVKVGALIAIITVVALFGNMWGNARASWIGMLVPEGSRSRFFGRVTMCAGIVGTFFALLEGTFLDRVRHMGIGAFSWLFGFGMAFGLLTVWLFLPQPDRPSRRRESNDGFFKTAIATFSNGPLMLVALYALLWSMQGIAGPFYATYMLRDLKMPFLGVGITNAAFMMTMLAFSPLWGHVVARHGCRPVLIVCTLVIAPMPLCGSWARSPGSVYAIMIPVNLLGGFAMAGVAVALNTLVYKVTPDAGRAVQFAIYSILVVAAASPMPALGGHLPGWLRSLGVAADLRCTFYASALFALAAAVAGRCIKEPDSRHTAEMLRDLPTYLWPVRLFRQAPQ